MIAFPNCKINLGLNILKKRPDGYHDLETIFYPLPYTDVLEVIENKNPGRSSGLPFTTSGSEVPGKPASNLCVKAYRILKKDFPDLPAVHIHLHKLIPAGAGLGGGSADASFTLRLLNQVLHLSLSNEQLIDYAAHLGSDCPFFIINKPCFARGRGEILEEIDLDLSSYKIVLVNPSIHIDTGRAFLNIHPEIPETSLKELIQRPIKRWKDDICNDFEKVFFPKYRELVDIKDYLYANGALYSSMSGSGSTVFGLFAKDEKKTLTLPSNYFVKELSLSGQR